MTRWATVALVALACCPKTAHSQAKDCRSIADSAARLACYDALPSPKAVPAEDPNITKAKAAILKVMREPASARFINLKVKVAADGSKGVCGQVSGKNAFGGQTGPALMVYDGKIGRVLVADAGAENPTSFDRLLLGAMLGENLKVYEVYCK